MLLRFVAVTASATPAARSAFPLAEPVSCRVWLRPLLCRRPELPRGRPWPSGRSGSVRIRRTGWKVLYVIAGLVVVEAVDQLIVALDLAQPLAKILSMLLFFGFVLLGARSFRGAGEAIEPPRAWWRVTARPTAGFLIAALSALFAGFAGALLVLRPDDYVLNNVGSGIGYAIVAAAYLHSSIRLTRDPPAQLDEELLTRKPIRV